VYVYKYIYIYTYTHACAYTYIRIHMYMYPPHLSLVAQYIAAKQLSRTKTRLVALESRDAQWRNSWYKTWHLLSLHLSHLLGGASTPPPPVSPPHNPPLLAHPPAAAAENAAKL